MTMTRSSSAQFEIDITDHGLGYNAPQKMGNRLWAPMWVLALMGFAGGIVVAIVRAGSISDGAAATTVQAQLHLGAGLMFIGFAAVFASISFAIARILGRFRRGGGEVQQAAGGPVHTLKMPVTAKVFMAGMMMAMMTLLVASIIHLVLAASTASGATTLADSESAAVVLEGVRRTGVALYLTAIAFGLGTITTVLRFQAIRLRELA